MPKLQKQLQIHLHRLPDFILQSARHLPKQSPESPDLCFAQTHPLLAQLLTQSAISHPSHSTPQCPPELSQPVTHPASPLSPHPITDSKDRFLLLRLHRLPQTLVQSALHLHKCISSPSQQNPQPVLHSALTEVSSELCFQEHPESEVRYPDVLTETHRANKDKTVQVLPQTVDPHTELQEGTQEEQEDRRGHRPEKEEEDGSVKETVLQNCHTTDKHYVLRSQNPAECTSVNALTGLTNGFSQKGLLQNKYKIRVDFKVSFCSCVRWHLY